MKSNRRSLFKKLAFSTLACFGLSKTLPAAEKKTVIDSGLVKMGAYKDDYHHITMCMMDSFHVKADFECKPCLFVIDGTAEEIIEKTAKLAAVIVAYAELKEQGEIHGNALGIKRDELLKDFIKKQNEKIL